MLFDEKVLVFCNYHNFIRVDVPGLGDCQLYSIATSHFNKELPNNASTNESLTKLKRSIINLHERNKNKFNIQNTSKYQQWRKYKVGEGLPKQLWMNDEDMRLCSYILKKCILVLSPKTEIYDIRAFLLIPRNNSHSPKMSRCVNEWVKMFEVTMSSDHSATYFPSTNNENKISINLKSMMKNGNLAIIVHQNDHYNAITSNEFRIDNVPTWPRIVPFNRWKLDASYDNLCPICSSSNENSFIQCDLCQCWAHKECMQLYYDIEALSEASNKDRFWCNICAAKINFYCKEHLQSDQTERSYLSWFFSHHVVKEDSNATQVLKLIKK